MSAADVDAVARGRVWTGSQAKVNGLVDHVGGLRQALARAVLAVAHVGRLGGDFLLGQAPAYADALGGVAEAELDQG